MFSLKSTLIAMSAITAAPVFAFSQTAAPATHRVSIEYKDLSGTQDPSSAPWVAHAAGTHLFQIGKPANVLMQELAENGNPEFILGTAVQATGKGDPMFGDIAMGLPNLAGQGRTVTLNVDEKHPMVSGGWMLSETNDGFAGIDAVDAFHLTRPMVVEVYALDAGTEKNTEAKSDVLGGLGRIPENGVIARHPGIRGNADIPASYKFDPNRPIGRITITPIT